MAKDVLRLSQVVGLFGPGSMVDLPERSVIVCGLDDWNMRGPRAFKPIEEPRLTEILRERLTTDGRWPGDRPLSLRTPPLGNNDPRLPSPYVQARIFPEWFTCEDPSSDDARRRRLVVWAQLDPRGRRDWIDEQGNRRPATPIRFVCGCQNGHLQDIDWKWVIHGSGKSCQEPMWMQEFGTSAEPRDTRVRCGCGISISLEQLFAKGRLGKCGGVRPWIGDKEPNCDAELKLLTRSATNTYFPQVATVISLPSSEDALTRRLHEVMSILQSVELVSQIATLRMVPQIAEATKGYSDEEVFGRLQQIKEETKTAAGKDPRIAEFELLASGRPLIGENQPHAKLYAETLDRSVWDPDCDPVCAGIASLVAVHRLRAVSCLYGFTRLEPAPLADDGLEDVGLAIRGASLGVHADWLPAIEQFGEGLFIQFAPDVLENWMKRRQTVDRISQLQQAATRWQQEMGRNPGFRVSGPYIMAHSLAHALMTEIALDCGYPASALNERIYALPQLNPSDPIRCGVLIYTATAGIQGTLGGLVEIANRFHQVIRSALTHLSVCSGDPICADHDPTARTDDTALHGAACHGCLLIAETSCEARNVHLDRSVLVDTMGLTGAGFFRL